MTIAKAKQDIIHFGPGTRTILVKQGELCKVVHRDYLTVVVRGYYVDKYNLEIILSPTPLEKLLINE